VTAVSTARSAATRATEMPRALRMVLALRPEIFLVGAILLVAGLAHGINMMHFPYPENDEATYMSQAWAVLNRGELAPYTYYYDHAPLGWLLIALWTLVTGGFFTFGTAVDSGRVLMLVLQLGSTLLLYRIAKNMTGSVIAATVAALLFSLSAYGLYTHRRVLLDNITTFWMLLSIYLLVSGRLTLRRVWASALALGASVLSKELTAFMVPAMAYLVFYRSDRSQRWLAVVSWSAIALSFVSLYVLMASLKGELFPTGSLLGGTNEHVSLLGTLSDQAARGKDGGLLQAGSAFWSAIRIWSQDEPLLVVVGGTASLVCTLLIVRWRMVGIAGLLTLSLWAFLARGGIVIGFYLVPLLPLLALDIAILLWLVVGWVTRPFMTRGRPQRIAGMAVAILAGVACSSGVLAGYLGPNLGFRQDPDRLWTNTEADAGTQAIAWVEGHLSPETSIVTDNYLWSDLHAGPGSHGGYQLAHYYWKVEKDPEIREGVFENNWQNVDYLLVSEQLVTDTNSQGFTLVGAALRNSTPIVRFDTGGWVLTVNRVDKLSRVDATQDWLLQSQWDNFKRSSISNGRVVNAAQPQVTLASDQAAAMQQAVYLNDRPTFDALWSWTGANLVKPQDGLLAADSSQFPKGRSDSGADTDTALALLFGAKRWNAPALSGAAMGLLGGIWQHETTHAGSLRIVTASDVDLGQETRLVRPAAFAPYAYRIFAQVDSSRPWLSLVDGSYNALATLRQDASLGGDKGLVPDAIRMGTSQGLASLSSGGIAADRLSSGSESVPFRMALDWGWFGDPRAMQELTAFSLPRHELSNSGRIAATYNLSGEALSEDQSLATYAQWLPAIMFGGSPSDRNRAFQIFAERVLAPVVGEGAPHTSAADAMWAWRATALMDGGLSNLWAGQNLVSWQQTPPPAVSQTSPATADTP
jgi:4-amino-4-deoxy-L-arabinose transferase-like glycosyltransferase